MGQHWHVWDDLRQGNPSHQKSPNLAPFKFQCVKKKEVLKNGTGKTTVARRVGMLFKSLDLLASADVVECSASDFVTGFVNQSGGQTRKVFESALGRVLFIDEAY
eukprot:scaffold98923_cov20-Tisochrysis_lutea.AAC.1